LHIDINNMPSWRSQQHCMHMQRHNRHSNVACCASTSPCAHWCQELFGGLSARHVPQGDGSWVAVNPHEAQLLQVRPWPRLAGCSRPCRQCTVCAEVRKCNAQVCAHTPSNALTPRQSHQYSASLDPSKTVPRVRHVHTMKVARWDSARAKREGQLEGYHLHLVQTLRYFVSEKLCALRTLVVVCCLSTCLRWL